MRNGVLSEDNHAFLHGLPTSVCGSSIGGVSTCGNLGCGPDDNYWDERAARLRSCDECKRMRNERCRVASGAEDTRFLEHRFVEAPAIFPKMISSMTSIKDAQNCMRPRMGTSYAGFRRKTNRNNTPSVNDLASVCTRLRGYDDMIGNVATYTVTSL